MLGKPVLTSSSAFQVMSRAQEELLCYISCKRMNKENGGKCVSTIMICVKATSSVWICKTILQFWWRTVEEAKWCDFVPIVYGYIPWKKQAGESHHNTEGICGFILAQEWMKFASLWTVGTWNSGMEWKLMWFTPWLHPMHLEGLCQPQYT